MSLKDRIAAAMAADSQKSGQGSLKDRIAYAMASENKQGMPDGAVSNEEFDAIGADGNEYSGWNTDQDQADAAREFYGGMTLGGADEIEAAWKGIFSDRNEGESFGDAYSRHKKQINEEQDKFRKENPGSALMLSLAGGVMTGGAEASLARKAGAKTIGKLAPALAKSRLAKNVGTASALGGTAGALSNDENRLRGAMMGAGLGGGISLIPAIAGKAGGALIKNRLGTKYDEAGEFIPLGIREDAPKALRETYNVIGKSFNPKYREQVEEYLGKRTARAEELERIAGKKAAQQKQLYRKFGNQLSDEKEAGVQDLLLKRREAVRKLEEVNLSETRGLNKALAGRTEQIKQQLEKEISDLDSVIRKESLGASMPSNIEDETAQKILSMKPQDALRTLEEEWSDKAFKYIKDKPSFDINKGKLYKGIEDDLKKVAGGKYMGEIEGILETTPLGSMKGNTLSGKDIMETRNSLGKAASGLGNSPEARSQKNALRMAQKKIDELVYRGLGTEDKARFADDLGRYKTKVVLEEAASGSEVAKREGEFTTDEYLSALASTQKKATREGTGSLQRVAGRARTEQLLKKATAEKEIEAAKREVAEKIKDKSVALSGEKQRLSAEDFPEKTALKQSIRSRKERLADRLERNDMSKVSSEAIEAKQLRDFVQKNKLSDPGLFAQLASSRILSSIVRIGLAGAGYGLGGVAGAAAVPIGSAIAGTAASKGFQKALLGQTGLQDKIRKEIVKYIPPEKRDQAFEMMMKIVRSAQTQNQ